VDAVRTDEHDDRWVVMEYVSGESLEDVIDRHPNDPAAKVLSSYLSRHRFSSPSAWYIIRQGFGRSDTPPPACPRLRDTAEPSRRR
jgi:serine/threonine protein kinase